MSKREPTGPPAAQPSAAQVEAELARVLGSAVFAQATRASDFLRFVVHETLAGRGDRLKGYAIAVVVFGRPEDFDAQSDPLVRVEAGRLRRRLIEYYHGEGRDDPLRIALPKTGYTPTFMPLAKPATPSANSARRARRKLVLRGAVLGGFLATVAALVAWVTWTRAPAPAPLTAGPARAQA